jgi:ribosomal protein L40E
MAFKDLLLLKEKEYRLYLILVVWLLVGFTLIQFEVLYNAGLVVFFILLIFAFLLFLVSLFSYKKKLREMSKKRLIISIIIIVMFGLFISQAFVFIAVAMFILAILSYILITSIFTMYYFYRLGVSIDNYLYKLPSSLKNFERWCFFLGGIIISIVLLILAIVISLSITDGAVGIAVGAVIIIIIIIFFGIIGAVHSLRGRLYAWMGIFFVWVAIYSIYLMIAILYSILSTDGGTTSSIPVQIALYFLSLFLLLNTIGGLLTEKSDVLKAKLRIFGPDTILMWLIFSVASFEFGAVVPDSQLVIIRYVIVYVFFIPLLIFMTIYGIRNYDKISKERIIQKLEKEAKKEGVIEQTQKICRDCGAVNNETNNYCDKCGAQLT